jgi:AcrR family transcriptional regulator
LAGRSRVTREAILEAAAKIISETGAASLTFQTLGETLGVTKQAIIYWFPSKSDLARDLIVPALELEADAVVAALRRVKTARKAIEVFLRTLVSFHLADLGRFRLIYVTAQFDRQIWQVADLPGIADRIHAATSRMYGALESVLALAPDFKDSAVARKAAVATHMAAVGALTMLSLADAIHDPLAHTSEALLDTLVSLTTGQLIRKPST